MVDFLEARRVRGGYWSRPVVCGGRPCWGRTSLVCAEPGVLHHVSPSGQYRAVGVIALSDTLQVIIAMLRKMHQVLSSEYAMAYCTTQHQGEMLVRVQAFGQQAGDLLTIPFNATGFVPAACSHTTLLTFAQGLPLAPPAFSPPPDPTPLPATPSDPFEISLLLRRLWFVVYSPSLSLALRSLHACAPAPSSRMFACAGMLVLVVVPAGSGVWWLVLSILHRGFKLVSRKSCRQVDQIFIPMDMRELEAGEINVLHSGMELHPGMEVMEVEGAELVDGGWSASTMNAAFYFRPSAGRSRSANLSFQIPRPRTMPVRTSSESSGPEHVQHQEGEPLLPRACRKRHPGDFFQLGRLAGRELAFVCAGAETSPLPVGHPNSKGGAFLRLAVAPRIIQRYLPMHCCRRGCLGARRCM
ncbi:hypothetical protein CYMTET_25485 [Cymbomonas tetramitiformis]|uniref:Uncharacterized protein n=1 Tax=Cymbomonas tetramitiformis TaxID=36881 RepID=A0AAE0KYW9_9CHLO|nr:hypothetical protein CYMTET_25485 [Cymbomonas tetramitiformis]